MEKASAMSRRSMSSRISPTLELLEIRIKLDRFGTPAVELHGEIAGVANRRVAAMSRAVVHTMHLPESGARFIEEMREAFLPAAEKAPAPANTATRETATG